MWLKPYYQFVSFNLQLNRLCENGAKVLVESRDTFWGGFDAFFVDPDEQAWEIAWAPFWKFDEQGSLKL